MKEKISSLKRQLTKLLHGHQAFVVIITVLLVLTAVFLRISSLSNAPIDQNYLNQEVEKVKPVQFNQDAIEEIEKLKDSNINDPGTQLPENRQNPFNE